MSFDMGQFTQVFFDEAKEHIATIEEVLLRLDLVEPGLEDLNAIFRAAHSIKGGAGTFGFADMADFTHVAETLLDRLRKQELKLTAAMVDALLESNDVIKSMLEAHQNGGEADGAIEQEVRGRLEALSSGEAPSAEPVRSSGAVARPREARRFVIRFPHANVSSDQALANLLAELRALGTLHVVEQPAPGRTEPDARWELVLDTTAERAELVDLFDFVLSPSRLELDEVEAGADIPGVAQAGDEGFGFFEEAAGAPPKEEGFGFFDDAAGAPVQEAGFGFFDNAPGTASQAGDSAERNQPFGFFDGAPGEPGTSTQAEPASSNAATPARRATDASGKSDAPAGRRATDKAAAAAASGDTSIRVSVEKVDQLINLVGELVITQSMLAQAVMRADLAVDDTLVNGIAQLERNSRDLQEAVMSIRMLPIAFVFSRFPRLVRDIAGKLGKNVDLKLVGEQTELDKGVIEKIADPLTHLVRNSLDHGLESAADREAAGKPAKGTITLRAFHQGGNIVIEVADDGRGLDREKILAKARSRGMPVDDSMSDAEVFGLIFEAGFSTAEQVTDISGRGVGMDVVRRNIMALGGRVDIASQLGKGCTVSIRLPLTLAILDGISVAVGDSLYIVPLGFIVESLQPQQTDIRTIAGSGLVMQVRGDYLPVVRLHDEMGVTPKIREFHRGITVIIESDGARAAMFVDELVGQHQVVIKSLESNYRKVPGISAATIMGDGRVAMILDVAHIVRKATSKKEYQEAA
ncbi:MAG: chemotaxis protein CheW [Betaproteobacteria bacterium]|nr:chemotaxis protein CheW [Betaproteobacteria bacterium]